MSDAGFLSLQRLTLAYGGTVAVDALDLTVGEGQLVALLGPSGCGKTTTMRAIAGLIAPRAGRIMLAGTDITRTPPNKRAVGLVFQSYALFPHLSVFGNVAFGLQLMRRPKDEIATRVADALATVGLKGFEHRLPKALSGGQQQRVALARSIVVRPRLLLLDEPLSNLDARLRLEMRTEISRLQRELGITMIYVTHDQAEALALASRVVVMNAGRVEQAGAPVEVYERPRSAFVARFMGYENTFRVADGGLVADDGRRLALIAPVQPGTAGLAWRPRGVTLGSGGYRGTVLGRSYLGQSTEYLIDTPLGAIKAETAAEGPGYAAGESVTFDLPLAAARPVTFDR